MNTLKLIHASGVKLATVLAVFMPSETTPALTLTLSPGRGNHHWPRRKKSQTGGSSPALEKVLPLPGGEGRGEGEREFQLNCSGLAAAGGECFRRFHKSLAGPRRVFGFGNSESR